MKNICPPGSGMIWRVNHLEEENSQVQVRNDQDQCTEMM